MQLGALHRSEHNAQADCERKRNHQQDMCHDEHDSAAKNSVLERAKVSVIAGAQHVEVVRAPCMIHRLSVHKLRELRPIYSVDTY